MFQIARRHLVCFTGLTCDELSAKVPRTNQSISVQSTKKKKKNEEKNEAHFMTRRLGAFGPSNEYSSVSLYEFVI